MKPNPNKYYICVENRVYSLTEKQYKKFTSLQDNVDEINIVNDKTQNDADKLWDAALEYIEKAGRFELELFTMFRY